VAILRQCICCCNCTLRLLLRSIWLFNFAAKSQKIASELFVLPSNTVVCANALPPTLCGRSRVFAGYLWSTGARLNVLLSVQVDSIPLLWLLEMVVRKCSTTLMLYTTPNALITVTIHFCYGGSTVLTRQIVLPILWSTGATTSSILVNTAGTYTRNRADANGLYKFCKQDCNSLYSSYLCYYRNVLLLRRWFNTIMCSCRFSRLFMEYRCYHTMYHRNCGDYTVTVTDGNGCTSSCTAKVLNGPLPNCAITGSVLSVPVLQHNGVLLLLL